MAIQDPQAEPSMEEILASIRRIISEEEQAPAEPVLDLTQTEEPVAASEEDDDIVFEAVEEEPEPEAEPVKFEEIEPPAPMPAPTPAPIPAPVEVQSSGDGILSPPTATAAAEALARLAGSLKISDTPNQTVEGVVRELLRPMLKEWLERNLPGIVESRVEAELERIARLVR